MSVDRRTYNVQEVLDLLDRDIPEDVMESEIEWFESDAAAKQDI